jgi:hypothetical protein
MWAIAQYDDRVLTPDIRALIKRNRAYCDKHGYEYIFEKKRYDLPNWWRKVALVKTLLESGKYKGILWLDTDAAVHAQNRRLEDFVIEGKSFYYASDPPRWDAEFNAGVWMVLNDTKGRLMIDKWMASYSPKDWTHTDGEWIASNVWAGRVYEQGAFHQIIPKFKKYIHKFPWQVLQSHCPISKTFIVHFMGDYRDSHLPKYLSRNNYTRKNNKSKD